MGTLLKLAIGLAAASAAVSWVVTTPKTIAPDTLSSLSPDLERGEWVFYAGGCASCHSAPNTTGDAKLVLAGGKKFPSDFGTFIAPNISSDSIQGIGTWTAEDLANAMLHGTSPDGKHYYPAFPYTSYTRMSLSDVASLHAFLKTLPADATPSQPHDVGFPFNIRRALGGWKLLFMTDEWIVDEDLTDTQLAGRYLVESLGHCGECHTPRNALGGLDFNAWLEGAANATGDGKIPAIDATHLSWSDADIAEYLNSGFTPDYDSAGGEMVDVIENMAHLSHEDRLAIAAYLKAVAQPDS